jgi:demethoxyubiquinone hydroxylase (CLK1/Coq7/Cat5 family)
VRRPSSRGYLGIIWQAITFWVGIGAHVIGDKGA